MNQPDPGDDNTQPIAPKPPWPAWTVFLLSLVAMVVWPLLGIAVGYSFFENLEEAVLLFGGVTGIILVPLYAVVNLSKNFFGAAIIAVWCFLWIWGAAWASSSNRSRHAQIVVMIVQSAVSLVQALLGLLMILAKSV